MRNAVVIAGAGAAAYKAIKRRQARNAVQGDEYYDEYDEDDREQVAAPRAVQTVPARAVSDQTASAGGTVGELERLKVLLDQGAITEEEFRAAKQQILRG
ncbi:SHOCT domain-containing protein [Planobispora takensis]|uniref:SHOCT domain-containing protein n=1 Tax=Planobispora takensis TaxID=1367882 RepID=UPI0019421672|nr:SHOCT domain-containing protein [Planobispora takensis]